MLQGGMGEVELVWWSDHGWPSLQEQLRRGALPIRVDLRGRKMGLNIRLWVDRDLKVQVESFALGFAVLVYPEDKLLGLYQMSYRFRVLLRQIEQESGVRNYPR